MKKTWIKYLGVFILSVVFTFVISIVDAIFRNQLVAGNAGLPFRFSETSLFGGGETNNLNLFFDIIFWFVVIMLFLKFLPKLFKHN